MSPKALRWQRLVFTMLFTSPRFLDWGSTREVIQAPQRGYVQFAVPDLDIYLRENAAEILERF